MEPLLCQSEEPFYPSNLKISKEVTVTQIKESKNNKLISMLKKLPEITFKYITPKPTFKVPEIPRLIEKTKNHNITHESKVILEKKGSSKKEDDNIIDSNCILIGNPKISTKTNPNPKKTLNSKLKKVDNNTQLLVKNNSNKIITKYPEKSLYSEKTGNKPRTSSPINKLLKKPQSISMIKSKIVTPRKKVLNTSIVSHEMKKIADNNSIINNTDVKTKNSTNENYMLADISRKSQTNIVSTSHPLDFINVCVPKYDSFVEGIDKLSENNTYSETFQNNIGNESLVGQELTQFSDFLSDVKTSLMLNNSNNINTDLNSQSYSIEENASLDNIQNEQLYVNINEFKNIENEVNELENKEKSNSKTTPIVLKDNQFLQEIKSFFCDNLTEKTRKDQLSDRTRTLQEISPNTIEDYLFVQTNKNAIKRCRQTQNDSYKKQKIDNENENEK